MNIAITAKINTQTNKLFVKTLTSNNLKNFWSIFRNYKFFQRCCGAMVSALDFGSKGCRFESCQHRHVFGLWYLFDGIGFCVEKSLCLTETSREGLVWFFLFFQRLNCKQFVCLERRSGKLILAFGFYEPGTNSVWSACFIMNLCFHLAMSADSKIKSLTLAQETRLCFWTLWLYGFMALWLPSELKYIHKLLSYRS